MVPITLSSVPPGKWAHTPYNRYLPYAPALPMVFLTRFTRLFAMNSTIDTVSARPFQHVTRLLRCQRTGRYFTGSGWSPNQSDARPFYADIDVAKACVSHNLYHIDLVLVAPLTGTQLFSTPVR